MGPEIPDPQRESETARAQGPATTRPGVPPWLRGLLAAGGLVLAGSLAYFKPAVAPNSLPESVPVLDPPPGAVAAEAPAGPGPRGISGLEMIRPLTREPAKSPPEGSMPPAVPASPEPETAGGFVLPSMPQALSPAPAPEVHPTPPRRRLEGFEPGSSREVRSWRAPRRESAGDEAPTSGAFVPGSPKPTAGAEPVVRQAPPPAPAPEAAPELPRRARARPASRSGGGTAVPAVRALPQVPQPGAAAEPPPVPAPGPAPVRTAPPAAGSMGDEAGSRAARGPMPPGTAFRCAAGSWRNTRANTCSKSKEDCGTTDARGACVLEGRDPPLLGK